MEYLSFDLRLGDWDAATGTGTAEVLQSPAGEGQRYRFRLDTEALAPGRRVPRGLPLSVDLGRLLFASVLFQQSLTLWDMSYQIARERQRGLRLRIHADAWELRRLPWELLYDARRGEYVVFDPMVSIVRYVRLLAVPPTLRQADALKLLVGVAAPADLAPLDWQGELRLLNDALHDLIQPRRVEIVVCEHMTHARLHTCLLENMPNVFHFIGHAQFDRASQEGYLLLEGPQGQMDPLGAGEAARLLRRYGTSLVVLNACETADGSWTGLAPALVRAEIPAVISMQWPVADEAASLFTRFFYRALSLGKTIDECVAEARVGLNTATADPSDWAAPVLFLRSLSGQLWTRDVLQPQREPAREALSAVLAAASAPASAAPSGAVRGRSEQAPTHYHTHGPLLAPRDESLLADRPELRRLVRIAQQPLVTQYAAVLSARQTGKTTLLLRLMGLLRGPCACVYVDLSVLRAQDLTAAYRYVAFRLMSELRALFGPAISLPEMGEIVTSVQFLEFLRQMGDLAPVPRIVLLFDEVGALAAEVSDAFFCTLRTVFTQGRGLNDQLAKYLCVFSGAVDLYDLTFGTASPLNICEKVYLQDLSSSEVARLVRGLEQLGVSVSDDAVARVYDLAGGHPYLTMRLCELVERSGVPTVTAQEIEEAAEQVLMDDDNIRHVLRKLSALPQEQLRLRGILAQERATPFSRNDPGLAALEMIGVIRPSQPCVVRSELYRRALLRYFNQDAETARALSAAAPELADEATAMYARLRTLREAALDARGGGRWRGAAWESYAAALFATIPAFSVAPQPLAEGDERCLLLAIDAQGPGGDYWSVYRPGILVTGAELLEGQAEEAITRLVRAAQTQQMRLVFAMSQRPADASARLSGTRDGVCLVSLE
ncbi:MAG: CHAT domain-containing protein, partial [Chloroflexota bacterium]